MVVGIRTSHRYSALPNGGMGLGLALNETSTASASIWICLSSSGSMGGGGSGGRTSETGPAPAPGRRGLAITALLDHFVEYIVCIACFACVAIFDGFHPTRRDGPRSHSWAYRVNAYATTCC